MPLVIWDLFSLQFDNRSQLVKQAHQIIDKLWEPPRKLWGMTYDRVLIDEIMVDKVVPPKHKPMPYYHHRRRF